MGISSTGDVEVLHEIGVIWGDGKADNVLVDMIDDAWLIAWMISWRVKYIFRRPRPLLSRLGRIQAT
jgi:hypothetical protein